MKSLLKIFALLALVLSMSVASVGCTGPSAVDAPEEEEGKVGGMDEDEYAKKVQGSSKPPQ